MCHLFSIERIFPVNKILLSYYNDFRVILLRLHCVNEWLFEWATVCVTRNHEYCMRKRFQQQQLRLSRADSFLSICYFFSFLFHRKFISFTVPIFHDCINFCFICSIRVLNVKPSSRNEVIFRFRRRFENSIYMLLPTNPSLLEFVII